MYCVYHGLSDFGHLEKATLKTHETNLSECSMGGSLKSPELSEPVELKGAMEIQWQDSDGLVYFRGPFDGVSRY